jgi:hypothetical protein
VPTGTGEALHQLLRLVARAVVHRLKIEQSTSKQAPGGPSQR